MAEKIGSSIDIHDPEISNIDWEGPTDKLRPYWWLMGINFWWRGKHYAGEIECNPDDYEDNSGQINYVEEL